MARGPAPRPNEITRALGNPGHKSLPKPQYIFPAEVGIPTPPERFQGEALSHWNEIWSTSPWLNKHRDGYWIETFCELTQEVERLKQQVSIDGLMVEGSMGQPTANPLLNEIRQRQKMQLDILRELGRSPVAASRLGLAEVKKLTKLEELRAKTQRTA